MILWALYLHIYPPLGHGPLHTGKCNCHGCSNTNPALGSCSVLLCTHWYLFIKKRCSEDTILKFTLLFNPFSHCERRITDMCTEIGYHKVKKPKKINYESFMLSFNKLFTTLLLALLSNVIVMSGFTFVICLS